METSCRFSAGDTLVILDSVTILARKVYFVVSIFPFYDCFIFLH